MIAEDYRMQYIQDVCRFEESGVVRNMIAPEIIAVWLPDRVPVYATCPEEMEKLIGVWDDWQWYNTASDTLGSNICIHNSPTVGNNHE